MATTNLETKRLNQMMKALNYLDDSELLGLFREANSYDSSYEFVDGWEMEEFVNIMIDVKRGSELVRFIQDVAEAVNNYDGSGSNGIEDAMWGYFDGYNLEIKDERDIIDEAREDYLEELAQDIIDNGRTSKFNDLPGYVEELLDRFDNEDYYGWEGAGTYRIMHEDGRELSRKIFGEDDFNSFWYWQDKDGLVDGKTAFVEFVEGLED